VVNYETYCQIRDHLGRQQLSVQQTAQALGLDARTVAKWRDAQFRPRAAATVRRASKLDPFKGQIVRWLDTHPYSAQQILQRLREMGFDGGRSIVKNYVALIRPSPKPAFLKLDFEPGECAQVDWGEYGTIAVGNTRRRLSLFVMVLCYSRRMYLEFTVSQTMEFFLACHEHAFAALGGVPQRAMVDNLKSAVLLRMVGQAPVLNPKYADFAKHWGFAVSPCNVRAGNEKECGSYCLLWVTWRCGFAQRLWTVGRWSAARGFPARPGDTGNGCRRSSRAAVGLGRPSRGRWPRTRRVAWTTPRRAGSRAPAAVRGDC
jgi:transposase